VFPQPRFLRRTCGQSRVALLGSLHTVFHSTAVEIARNLTFLLRALLWLEVAFWVHRDARRRIKDPRISGTATLV
jgi:hypothetical protein